MFLVFDIETTGFYEMSDDVIEFSYILFDHNNQYVRAETLYFYYEGMSWSEEAFRVHKIPMEFLKTQAEHFKENLIKMYSVLSVANVAGHNVIRFDCPFVKTWLTRMGLPNLKFGITLDTMVSFRPVTKKSRIKLTTLTDLIGISPDNINFVKSLWFPNSDSSQPHDAEYDTTATALLVLEGIRRGYMLFDRTALAKTFAEVDQVSSEPLTQEAPKMVDPNYYVVFLEDNDGTEAHSVNHDRSKFADYIYVQNSLDTLVSSDRVLPVVLKLSAHGTYEAEAHGFHLTFHEDESGDTLMVSNSFMSTSDVELGENFPKFLGANFGKEDIECLKTALA